MIIKAPNRCGFLAVETLLGARLRVELGGDLSQQDVEYPGPCPVPKRILDHDKSGGPQAVWMISDYGLWRHVFISLYPN